MYVEVEPDEDEKVVPGKLTLWMATLSVATSVNVTVWVSSEDLSSTEVSSALKLLIVGTWSSILLRLIVIVSVAVFPAPSTTVAVRVSLWSPKV